MNISPINRSEHIRKTLRVTGRSSQTRILFHSNDQYHYLYDSHTVQLHKESKPAYRQNISPTWHIKHHRLRSAHLQLCEHSFDYTGPSYDWFENLTTSY